MWTCDQCGRHMLDSDYHWENDDIYGRYCSQGCLHAAMAEQGSIFDEKCPWCGKTFNPVNGEGHFGYCSQACYNAAQQNKAANQVRYPSITTDLTWSVNGNSVFINYTYIQNSGSASTGNLRIAVYELADANYAYSDFTRNDGSAILLGYSDYFEALAPRQSKMGNSLTINIGSPVNAGFCPIVVIEHLENGWKQLWYAKPGAIMPGKRAPVSSEKKCMYCEKYYKAVDSFPGFEKGWGYWIDGNMNSTVYYSGVWGMGKFGERDPVQDFCSPSCFFMGMLTNYKLNGISYGKCKYCGYYFDLRKGVGSLFKKEFCSEMCKEKYEDKIFNWATFRNFEPKDSRAINTCPLPQISESVNPVNRQPVPPGASTTTKTFSVTDSSPVHTVTKVSVPKSRAIPESQKVSNGRLSTINFTFGDLMVNPPIMELTYKLIQNTSTWTSGSLRLSVYYSKTRNLVKMQSVGCTYVGSTKEFAGLKAGTRYDQWTRKVTLNQTIPAGNYIVVLLEEFVNDTWKYCNGWASPQVLPEDIIVE